MRYKWMTGNPPNVEEKYLVQLDDGEFAISKWTRYQNYEEWHWSFVPPFTNVVAWMFLPEPYAENKGIWKYSTEDGRFTCSKCGKRAPYDINEETAEECDTLFDFCPFCGADMR